MILRPYGICTGTPTVPGTVHEKNFVYTGRFVPDASGNPGLGGPSWYMGPDESTGYIV